MASKADRSRQQTHDPIVHVATAELEHRLRVPQAYGLIKVDIAWLADNFQAAVSLHAKWIGLGRTKSRPDLMVPGS